MKGKIGLEEHFAIDDTLNDSKGFFPDNIWVEVRDFHFTMSREDYITGRDITSVGRFLRQMLDEEMWEIFRRRTREVFAERFPERVNDFRDAVFAVGHKP